MKFNTTNLLGMNKKIMKSKKLQKKYKKDLEKIYDLVMIYMQETKRFKNKKFLIK